MVKRKYLLLKENSRYIFRIKSSHISGSYNYT